MFERLKTTIQVLRAPTEESIPRQTNRRALDTIRNDDRTRVERGLRPNPVLRLIELVVIITTSITVVSPVVGALVGTQMEYDVTLLTSTVTGTMAFFYAIVLRDGSGRIARLISRSASG